MVKLASDNVSFSNDENLGGASVANGTGWTMAALLASSAGVPYKLSIKENTADKYEKFLLGIITLGDTHHQDGYICDFCGEQYEEQYANVLSCSSNQVFDFIKWIQGQEWYENITIVITGDHLSMKADFWDDIGE
ncbi:hypothetical protein [Candidatus Merdisoma sp. JLR.KK006]|uniref:hypothetical protein n=1 Tax=Candidatus Merdisoma sp. JLR.KK006 TaxID=3112626 RepID=UPI002FF0D6C7